MPRFPWSPRRLAPLVPVLAALGAGPVSARAAAGERPQDLVAELASAEPAERPRLVFELIDQGPEALETVREARDAAEDPGVHAALARAAAWILAEDAILPLLEAGVESQLSFDGQYRELARHGDEAVEALLRIIDDTATDFPLRLAACRAVADVAGASVIPRLRRLESDILLSQGLREQMGILLAIFGDRHAVRGELEEYRRYAQSERLSLRLTALTQLANLHYRIRDYEQAVEHYEEILAIHRGLLEREPAPPLRERLESQLTLHYYNAACSNALAGEIERAKEYLRRAVRGAPEHYDNMEKDGDLRALREHPSYEEFRRQLGRLFENQDL